MAGREQAHRHSPEEPEEDAGAETGGGTAQVSSSTRDEETDALLEEIDGVLESNAQDFVHSFVQKGGQ
ncbi:MAG TPA: ubiquitin-like protein Pup [Ornithinimicrobium sp.]|uniref:ubiquitin-like protein Pup n=1 Tax=Ornithinimicrobium sp. TaxID=1977084 RepID=UPI002B462CC1|nr:ubiquitin-like protein Pup [Ornithinimicrobium sp.]HKJ12507.1 ubiquitin-like protein Pup [Ornithinimicrobium sp.]